MWARCSLTLAVLVTLAASVSSMDVFTSKEVQAVNGTDARLKCTFSSSSPLGDDVTVSWTFRPLLGGNEESVCGRDEEVRRRKCVVLSCGTHPIGRVGVCDTHRSVRQIFYYHREPFPPRYGRFLGRAVWDGSIQRSDASIMIRNVQQPDNGTYLCQVKNPPDVHGEMGEIQLKVVDKVKFSEIMLLALVIGVGSVVIILGVLAVVLFRYYRNQKTHSTAVSVMECTEKLTEKTRHGTDVNA